MADDTATHVLVILNPTSGGGAGRRVRGEIERALASRGVQARLVETEGRGHATRLAAEAARNGISVVAAAGGDGTIHEVVNGLLDAGGETALALIPVGTGNDFVKVVPGTRPRSAAYDTLAAGHVRRFDAALATWPGVREYFTNAAGAGIDVEVVRQIESLDGLPGGLRYGAGLVRALVRYRPVRMHVTSASGQTLDRRVMLSAVSNGACLGGVFRLTPTALPDDGMLDLCVVEELGLLRSAAVARRVLGGTHAGHPSVTMWRDVAFDVRIDGGGPFYLQLDGELREVAGDSVRIEVVPGALRVISRPVDAAHDA